jgi:SAM-dependent methyltransferase
METTNTSDQLKQLVKEQYGSIAEQSRQQNASSCCGGTTCSTIDSNLMAENYSDLKGYVPDADLGLGCGIPTEFARIKEGDTVIDLGSGAGNDCFVARSIVGTTGKVIGIDFTENMISKARKNADKLNYNNVEFRFGDIEDIPVGDEVADVVVSNCVLNLVPDKRKAFQETFRVLKKGGHFSVSDIVLEGSLPENLKNVVAMYAGCISGAIQKEDYLQVVKETGFTNIEIQKEKTVVVPDEILMEYISTSEIEAYRASGAKILSITVYADKSSDKKDNDQEGCCGPDCCK